MTDKKKEIRVTVSEDFGHGAVDYVMKKLDGLEVLGANVWEGDAPPLTYFYLRGRTPEGEEVVVEGDDGYSFGPGEEDNPPRVYVNGWRYEVPLTLINKIIELCEKLAELYDARASARASEYRIEIKEAGDE